MDEHSATDGEAVGSTPTMRTILEDKMNTVRGTRLLIGDEAKSIRSILSTFRIMSDANGFEEIILPSLEFLEVYTNKAGKEIENQMYVFKDKSNRSLCLRPEGTATCQILANTIFKYKKDVKLFYEIRCWRYEKPQAGRYREFTQFGVEILNPSESYHDYLLNFAKNMVEFIIKPIECKDGVKRGLSYYTQEGFEISAPILGAQKQIVGGGRYKEGIGFAIGVDRLQKALKIQRGVV